MILGVGSSGIKENRLKEHRSMLESGMVKMRSIRASDSFPIVGALYRVKKAIEIQPNHWNGPEVIDKALSFNPDEIVMVTKIEEVWGSIKRF